MADINVTEEIIDINVTEDVINIVAPTGAYPLPNAVNSVFGRIGNIVAAEGDYSLTQLSDVTLSSPSNGQVLKYNGTSWVNDSDAGITGSGTTNTLPKFTGASALGNSNITDTGSLITLGSNTLFNGNIGIGTNPIGNANAFILRNLTGSTSVFGITIGSIIQSDATSNAFYFRTDSQTAAATFTLNNLVHYQASQGTFGAGSTITNQSGFVVTANTIGAANNYGFRGQIPVGTNRWNIYMDGTANNYMAGGLGIGSTSLTGFSLNVGKSITGATSSYGISQIGSVQSDVTSSAFGIINTAITAASAFTLINYNHFYAQQGTFGAGSSVTNQSGYRVDSTLIGATNNYGFRGQIPNGTNRWNLYMDGTADNYMAGKLALGSTAGSASRLVSNRLFLTGGTLSIAYEYEGNILSDVTSEARGYSTYIGTQGASFTLANLTHYQADQGLIGAGSSVTTQNGFYVRAALIGANSNYGFRGSIPVGTNRWNLYMDGMAANYLAGDTGIGTTSLGTATQLTIGGSETAVSAIARGQLINSTLVASANGDTLVGLDINPTYTIGAFTGVSQYGLRIIPRQSAQIALGGINQAGQITFARGSDGSFQGSIGYTSTTSGGDFQIFSGGGSGVIGFQIATNRVAQFNAASGNLTLQNGGTFTDAGFRLDVNGTTRFIGTASSDTAPLGSELAAVTGTGTNWTLAGTNLNVGGYTHATGSVVALTTALAAVNGTYYQIVYTITGRTTGSITIDYGGTSTSGITATGNTGPLASSTAVLTITPTTDFNGTVVLSIKSIGTSIASITFAPSAGSPNTTEIRANAIQGNTFVGLNAGTRNTTAQFNSAFGVSALQNNTTGQFNTAISRNTLQNNTTGSTNTAIGHQSLNANTIGSSNTALGASALQQNTTGIANTACGRESLFNNTTGSQNVAIGSSAGRFITGGSTANTISTSSIFIGVGTRAAADNQTNQIVIGVDTTGLGTNTTIIGTTATTITGLYGNIRLVSGMGTAPATSTSTGTTGDIVVTAGFIYVCSATNTWVRTALTTF
jgi:hypothetical protein